MGITKTLRSQNMRTVLKLTVGCCLLAILFFSIDWAETWSLVANANIGYLCLAFLLFPLGLLASAWKWRILIRPFSLSPSLSGLLSLYYIGFFANNFLPTIVGGDFTRFALVSKPGERSVIGASILVERLIGIFVLFLWALFALFYGRTLFAGLTLLPVLWIAVTGGLLALSLVWLFSRPILTLLEKRSDDTDMGAGKVIGLIGQVAKAVLQYRNHSRPMIEAIAISAIFYLTPLLLQFLLYRAIGVDVSILTVITIAPIVLVVCLLPVSFNSLGLAEGASVVLYAQAGVPAASALAVALIARLLQLLASLPGGVFWFFRRAR